MRAMMFATCLAVAGVATGLGQAAAARYDRAPSLGEAAQEAAKAFIRATTGASKVQGSRPSPLSPTRQPNLGVAFAITAGGAQIIAVMPRSPAEAAGLVPGRLVTSVNGVTLAGLTPDAAIDLLRTPSRSITYGLAGGTVVTLYRPVS